MKQKLSKKELKLRVIIRESVLVELTKQSRRLFLNSAEHAGQIAEIKAREEQNAKTIGKMFSKLEWQLTCKVKTGHHFSVEYTNECRTSFRCINCELSYGKDNQDLNDREKKLLSTVLGKDGK